MIIDHLVASTYPDVYKRQALYWILSATGLLIMGKTSNFIVLDSYNALLVIPFGNFGCQYKSLAPVSYTHLEANERSVLIWEGNFLVTAVPDHLVSAAVQ